MNCVGTPNKCLGNLMQVVDIFHLTEEGKNRVGLISASLPWQIKMLIIIWMLLCWAANWKTMLIKKSKNSWKKEMIIGSEGSSEALISPFTDFLLKSYHIFCKGYNTSLRNFSKFYSLIRAVSWEQRLHLLLFYTECASSKAKLCFNINCSAVLQSSFLPCSKYLYFKIFLPYVLPWVFIFPKLSHFRICCLFFKPICVRFYYFYCCTFQFSILCGFHYHAVNPSFTDLMKMLNKIKPNTNPYGTPLQLHWHFHYSLLTYCQLVNSVYN